MYVFILVLVLDLLRYLMFIREMQEIGVLVSLFCLFHAGVGLIIPSLARLRTMYGEMCYPILLYCNYW